MKVICAATPAALLVTWALARNDSGAVFLYDWPGAAAPAAARTTATMSAGMDKTGSLLDFAADGDQLDRLIGVLIDAHAGLAPGLDPRGGRHRALAGARVIHLQLEDGELEAFARLGADLAAPDEEDRLVGDDGDDAAGAVRHLLGPADRELLIAGHHGPDNRGLAQRRQESRVAAGAQRFLHDLAIGVLRVGVDLDRDRRRRHRGRGPRFRLGDEGLRRGPFLGPALRRQ